MTLKTFFSNLINSLLDGSFERVRIISQMNTAFKEYFTTGEFNRLCKVSISQGNSAFAHEMSSLWIRSGFKISIENDSALQESEVNEFAAYVTDLLGLLYVILGTVIMLTNNYIEAQTVACMYFLYGPLAAYFGVKDFITILQSFKTKSNQ